jgi:UDP-glucose 4-epimerase
VKIDGARILVTGGAGFIGCATVERLLRDCAPERVVILDDLSRGRAANLGRALQDRRVELVPGDIRDEALVRRLVRGMDAVVHLAALRITACAADPAQALQVMCDGSFTVVASACAAGVKKLVAASSASVYGQAQAFPTAEDHHPYNNQTWYGTTKLMLEGLLRSYHAMHGLGYVALRYFNVYGPRMDVHGKYTEVLIRWMERIADGRPPLILGDGTQTMDFVYVDDVAAANVLALQGEQTDEVFNIASGTETSLDQLAGALLRAMGSSLRPEYGAERKVNPVARRWADVRKAQRLLGFSAQVELEEGLSRLVAWWRGTDRAALRASAIPGAAVAETAGGAGAEVGRA